MPDFSGFSRVLGSGFAILSGSFFLPGEFSFAHPHRNPKLCLLDAVVAYQYILIIPSVCCF